MAALAEKTMLLLLDLLARLQRGYRPFCTTRPGAGV